LIIIDNHVRLGIALESDQGARRYNKKVAKASARDREVINDK
jgi:hypothetical protein